MNNLFLSTTFLAKQTPLLNALQLCEKNGINAVELGSNHSFEATSLEIINQFDFDYLVHNYFPIPKKSFVLNIASMDDEIYNKSINHIFNAIDFCDKIGASLYTFHPGFMTDPRGSNQRTENYDFQWEDQKLNLGNYDKAFERMIKAVSKVVDYVKKVSVCIAIETQGSVKRKDHLLMQRPDEYYKFFHEFSSSDIGVNLNVGHLRLASNAFGFNISDFVNLVSDYILAMEMSHNNGGEDQHLPLEDGEWYWDVITDSRFTEIPKIMEYRNTPIEIILDNMNLVKEYLNKQINFSS